MKKTDLFDNFFRGKKILITGHTGFKGSWLSIWLNDLGAKVYGYALEPATSKDNFVTAQLASKIYHRIGDIRDKDSLSGFFEEVKPDIALHLAAQPLVLYSYNEPHYNFETNVMGTVNFFEAVRRCSSVKVAINVTTDKCYQNKEWLIGYHENDAMGGDDPYSASKGCSELITHAYQCSFFSAEGSTTIASARAGNVIGGGDWAENRIIPDAIRANQSEFALVLRNPDSIRPWQFVLEPLYGYLLLAKKLWVEGKSFSGGWNFGPSSTEIHTVAQVINEVKKLLPSLRIQIDPSDQKLHEAALLKLDVTKAMTELLWLPKLDFEQTIYYTIKGYLDEQKYPTNLYEARVKQIETYCSIH